MIARFNRYLLWEITKLFVIALAAFTTLIMLVGVGQELARQGLGPVAMLQLLPYLLPISLQFALPATLLFAVCSVYGRVSADNEVIALTASGIRPMAVIGPTLVFSAGLSLFAVWLNDIAVSWGMPGINRVVMHSIEQVAYGYLSSQGSYSSAQGFSIHVHGIGEDGRELIRPTITTQPQAGGEALSITAKSARMRMDPVEEMLHIELVDSEIALGDYLSKRPGLFVHSVKLSDATKKGIGQGRPTEYPMRQISAVMRKQRESIDTTEELMAARSAMAIASGRYDWLDDTTLHTEMGSLNAGNDRLNRLRLEPWRRWASGFTCLCFVWLGIPLAIWMRSADHWTSFGTCFMPILLIYYPVFATSLGQIKDGNWPPITVWLSNIVLLVIGTWWLRKLYHN